MATSRAELVADGSCVRCSSSATSFGPTLAEFMDGQPFFPFSAYRSLLRYTRDCWPRLCSSSCSCPFLALSLLAPRRPSLRPDIWSGWLITDGQSSCNTLATRVRARPQPFLDRASRSSSELPPRPPARLPPPSWPRAMLRPGAVPVLPLKTGSSIKAGSTGFCCSRRHGLAPACAWPCLPLS